MSDHGIIVLAMYLIYYHISGLATTNILRLTKGSTTAILASHCYCDHCGSKIPPLLQLPMISYLLCGGKCKSCGTKIPLFPLLLEISVFLGMCLTSTLLGFTWVGVLCSYLYYELVRVLTLLRLGKRGTDFVKQYAIAVLSMIPFCLLTLFVALLYAIT